MADVADPAAVFRARDRRFIALAASLFVTAMGANAFVQFAVPYLIGVRGWSATQATLALIVAFLVMPCGRLSYPFIAGHFGDYGALLIGHLLYFVFLAVLILGTGSLAQLTIGVTLGLGSALVFMAGPLQIMALAANGGAGKASGSFFATNFLAWLIAIPAYGALIKWQGLAAGPYAAAVVTGVGAAACAIFTPRARPLGQGISWHELRSQLFDRSIQSLGLLMFISSFSFGFMFGTFATFVTAVYGAVSMSFLALGFYFSRLPSSLLAGLASDRYGPNLALAVTFAAAAIAMSLTAWRFDLGMLAVALVMLGSIQAAVFVIGMSTVTLNTPAHLRPIALAPVMGAAEVGVGATLALGLVLQNVSPNPAPLLAVASVAYSGCFLLLIVWRPLRIGAERGGNRQSE